jgi:hypothetical protein
MPTIIEVNVQTGERTEREMTPEEVAALPPVPPPVIPQSVTMRQARLALLGAGLLDDVDAAIAAIPDATQRRAAEIEWEYAQTVDRTSAFTLQLAGGLGITPEQMDQLFTQAVTL